MLNLREVAIEHFVNKLKQAYDRMYSDLDPQFRNIVVWCGTLALENIANSDALYHDYEHTMMVALAGQAIIEGKHLRDGGVEPKDWLHFMVALLCHDIGYVRGTCKSDRDGMYATGIGDKMVEIPPGGTDIALSQYHVDRSKLFVRERFGGKLLMNMEARIDAERIASFIEMTRFPPPDGEMYQDTKGYGGLVRAADFIGQLGDPNHLRKSPALFYEFEEIGANSYFGYEKPGDLRTKYPRFFWDVVSPYIQDAVEYLRMTQEGKQWIANLHSHVFATEHEGGVGVIT